MAPRVETARRRAATSGCSRARRCPTSASTPSPGGCPRSTGSTPLAFAQMRPGCYDIHERIRDMNVNGVLGSLNFPSIAGFAGQLFYTCDGQGHRHRAPPRLQRLARRRLVRHLPRPDDPAVDPAALGPGAHGRRGPPDGRQGLPRRHLLREPREARAARAGTATTGTRSCAACEERNTVICLHIGSSSRDGDHGDGRADRHDDHAAADEHRASARPTWCGRRCSGSSRT